jgi:hypothetical protein
MQKKTAIVVVAHTRREVLARIPMYFFKVPDTKSCTAWSEAPG